MTLKEQADAAWRRNDFKTAYSLFEQAFLANRTVELACHLAVLTHAMGKSQEARDALVILAADYPTFTRAQTQLARIVKMDARASSPEARQEIAERRALLATMRAALDRDPFFKPSLFWDEVAQKHERMLDTFGIDNFKRTVAHNFHNWLICKEQDVQWQQLRTIWKNRPTYQPVLNSIELVDDAGLNWDVETPYYPLSDPPHMTIYKLSVGILWEQALAQDHMGFLENFEEPLIGNPIRLRRNGRLISQDAAHSAHELNLLFRISGLAKDTHLTFAELGAGQGRLAEMVGRCTNHRFVIFDIPPTLAVSQWYIQQLFPNEKIFTFRDFDSWTEVEAEFDASRFAFFLPNQIKHFPAKSIDVFLNICSLMEMKREQIAYFLDRIGQITRRTFMSKQWYKWKNKADNITVTKDDFRLAHGFVPSYDAADEIHSDLFIQIWERTP
jgi:putative sugar O-methyltransferase